MKFNTLNVVIKGMLKGNGHWYYTVLINYNNTFSILTLNIYPV